MGAEITGSTANARPRLIWTRALALAVGAVYGPQAAMAVFTLCAVSCQDCRATIWTMLAVAPGVEIAAFPCVFFRIPRPATSDTANLLIVSTFSILALAAVAALLRHWKGSRWPVCTGFALVFAVGVFLLPAMIRA